MFRNKKKKKNWNEKSVKNVKKNARNIDQFDHPVQMVVAHRATNPFQAPVVCHQKYAHLDNVLECDLGV
jgi:hypothetical protein